MKNIFYDLENQGFVQIKRSIQGSEVFANPNLLRVYLWCHLKATFKPKKVGMQTSKSYINISLKRGEFITGRYAGAEDLNINPSTFWSWLKKIEKYGKIKIKSHQNFSIVKVKDYGYSPNPNDNQMTQYKNENKIFIREKKDGNSKK